MKLSKSKPNSKQIKRITFNNYPLKKSNSSSLICSNISVTYLYKLLKENKSLINAKDSKNQTFLSYAIQRNNNEIINLIMTSPSLDLSYKDIEGNTYIHLAVIYNNISLIESLIKKGIDINRKNNDGNTSLHLAYLYNRSKIINILIDNNADKNIKNNKNKTPEEMKSKNNMNNEYFLENINGDNNNENSELSNSTQLDWVRSAIEVKTKNNEIIKLSLDNDNCFEQNKIKVNKLEKFKEYDNEETKKYIIRDNYDNDDNNDDRYNKYIELDNKMKASNNIGNTDKNSSNKEYNMVSTKASEKIDKNFQYLSNKRNKNIEITFPDNIKNINDENNEEDIVNMKTTSIFNIKPELNNTNANLKDNVYKKRINMGYLYSKNNLKNSLIKPKLLDIRNSNNYYQNNSNFNSNIDDEDKFNKTNKNFLSFYSINNQYNKKSSENNISIANLYKRRIGSEISNLNVNEIGNNITTYSKKKLIIMPIPNQILYLIYIKKRIIIVIKTKIILNLILQNFQEKKGQYYIQIKKS
jgi:ankyrin repeat protein